MPSTAKSVEPRLPQSRTILVVDDHVDSADVIATALAVHEYEARAAYDALSALAIAQEFRPEIAILDIDLPTIDGYELGAALREDLPSCKFIALTRDTSGLNRLRSQWAGFDGYLAKPVRLDDLLMAVADSRPSGVYPRQSPRQQRERALIHVQHSTEVVRYWTTALACTECELRAAVNEVGIIADDVRNYLKKLRAPRPAEKTRASG